KGGEDVRAERERERRGAHVGGGVSADGITDERRAVAFQTVAAGRINPSTQAEREREREKENEGGKERGSWVVHPTHSSASRSSSMYCWEISLFESPLLVRMPCESPSIH